MKTLFRQIGKAVAIPFLRLFYRLLRVDKIYKSYLYKDSKDIPSDVQYCLILGARLFGDDSLTPMLIKRLNTAIELFEARPHVTFILSGDGSKRFSNDVQAMYTYLKQHSSIPDEQILFDYHGYTTLDSIRHITPEMNASGFIILTSAFHMPRCVYICHRLGLNPFALHLPASYSRSRSGYRNREQLSLVKAWFILTFGQPQIHKGIHKLLFESSFFTGKVIVGVSRIMKRTNSNIPGKTVLRLCPYFLQYVTESLSMIFIVGTNYKNETIQILEHHLKTQKIPYYQGVSSECSQAEIASVLLFSHKGLFFKQTKSWAVFNCSEIDFYKITRNITSPVVKIFVTDLSTAAERNYIHVLTGIDQIPCADIYLNSASETAVSIKNEISNPVYYYTPDEFT